jgi:hypothetical protein
MSSDVADYSDDGGFPFCTMAHHAGNAQWRREELVVGECCRHGILKLARVAFCLALILAPPIVGAQQSTSTLASALTGAAETEQPVEREAGQQATVNPKTILGEYVGSSTGAEPAPPAYKLLRYEEDYRYLTDPTRRTDFWDPIKYIPIGCCDDWFLSLGGQLRERYEFLHNANADAAPANAQGDNQDYLQRYLLHGDLHLGPYFRFFGQFVSGQEAGRIGGPRPDIDQNAFDIHQGFADFVLPLQGENDSLTARIGRQEFQYGTGRLIDVRDGVNLRLAFDAARLLLRTGDWQVDGWWSKPIRNRPGAFDDDPNPNRSFWGVYGVHPLALLPEGNVDLYYLGFENKQAVYVQGTGYELRNSLGARLLNTFGNLAPLDPESSRRGPPHTRFATTSAICR